MSIFDKLSFINETISVNGQPVNDDETVDDVAPDYTGDNPEDEPSKNPNRDAPPETPDPPAPAEDTPPADNTPEEGNTGDNTEDDAPDYTADSPEGDDAGDENPDAGEPTATNTTADTPEENTGNEETPDTGNNTPGTENTPTEDNTGTEAPTGDTGNGENDAPDYTEDSPEGDNTGTETPADNAAGEGEDEAPDYTTDSPEGGGNENTPDTGNGEEGGDEAPDYTEDSPEGDGDTGDENKETEDGTNDAEVTNAGEDDEIDQLQKDVFADMTPAQIAIKDKEQKTQFITLFSDIASALERLNLVGRNSTNMRTIEFVTRKFIELKDNVKDYLVYTYDNESYTKNTFNLNRFIAIYASLIELIENMVEEKKKLEGETSKTESAFQEFFGFAKDLNQDIGTKYRYAGIIHSIE